MFAQVTSMRTRQGWHGRGVTEPRSRRISVTFWVTSAGSGETLAAVGTRPRLGAVNVDMEPCVRRRGNAPSPGALQQAKPEGGFPGRSIRAYPR